ncbi:alpha,alpha-trehalase TreF [Hymenobacter sp. BT770]|uniref:alpha,alpha-trehalase TreF n=1 Tax=Hymenobacter sp. BT770 TaxID=2886942 RepID=UPI001D12E371|nr:alpha,alpha-trehalase TreF [Hymenobacter sp. BT770]MCC3153612.1 alpha,alpha-trehalase TreF [Hymenobacter sp. BT770]MDO3415922.1 alpha,alpha-trehalase TreF [Hymenobacter sp. BT770]
MRKLFLAVLLALSGLAAAQTLPPSPRQLFPGLFEAVQLGRVYPDNKTFVDAVAKEPAAEILRAYAQQKDTPGFDLKAFVAAHFTPPAPAGGQYHSEVTAGLRHHLDTLWTVLQRRPDSVRQVGSSLLPLPRPYIVPGGRFREVYYWDSYFTMLGLAESHRTTVIRDMVDNFAYLLDTYGFIPNGTRTYYLTRSQPPFFALMVGLLAEQEGTPKTLLRYQPQLLREYAYWMRGAEALKPGTARLRAVRMPHGELLNRYYDTSDQPREESYAEDVAAAKLSKQTPAQFYRNIRAAAASGWDFSTRWFGPDGQLGSIQTTDMVPVDLNCLLYNLENTIAKTYQQQGNPARANAFLTKAQNRKKAILAYCWDAKAGWFVDYNLRRGQRSALQTLAGVYPLKFGIATPPQAAAVGKGLQQNFLKPGGLATTRSRSGQQWDAPNAWAPLQSMAIDGLERYHQSGLARTIGTRWIDLNSGVFQQTGKLMEKYNVVDPHLKAGGGEYPLQDGFGWTNGVLLRLINKYKSEKAL